MTTLFSAGDRTPFVYTLFFPKLDKTYIGVRYAKGCHPSDILTTYFTSSKTVNEYFTEHGHGSDVVEVVSIETFETVEDSISRESELLLENDAARNPAFLNKHDSVGICPMVGEDNGMYGKNHTLEARGKMSEKVNERWSDPEYRKTMSGTISEKMKAYWDDEDLRNQQAELMAERSKKLWEDPGFRERKSDLMSEMSKKFWEDPEYRGERSKKMYETSKKLWEDPEYRAIRSASAKKLWEDPEFREKRAAQVSEQSKKLWEDPEFREKVRLAKQKRRDAITPVSLWENKKLGLYNVEARTYELIERYPEQKLLIGNLNAVRGGRRPCHKGWVCLIPDVNA